jgi:putative ABC transport system substrate-binding protein
VGNASFPNSTVAGAIPRAFRQGLKEAGFVEDENVKIVYRWAEGNYDQLTALAADLVRRPVTVIASGGGIPAAAAAKTATTTIPIVFAIPQDPVGVGLVASLARPGGNLTGVNFFTTELAAKRLELLRGLVPGLARVAVLVNPANPNYRAYVERCGDGCSFYGIASPNHLERQQPPGHRCRFRKPCARAAGWALYRRRLRRMQLTSLTLRHAVPAAFSQREYVEIGALMSYGPNISDAYRQVGVYAGRILKGAKPADLPVVQSSKFEFVINAHAARMFGLTVPDKLLVAADEVTSNHAFCCAAHVRFWR